MQTSIVRVFCKRLEIQNYCRRERKSIKRIETMWEYLLHCVSILKNKKKKVRKQTNKQSNWHFLTESSIKDNLAMKMREKQLKIWNSWKQKRIFEREWKSKYS